MNSINALENLKNTYTVFKTGSGGIESLLWGKAETLVCKRIVEIKENPLSKVQFNQLLGFKEERGVSDDFFRYYWLSHPKLPYRLSSIEGYDPAYSEKNEIISVEHLFYGLRRIFIDGLLHFGNVRQYYRQYCSRQYHELASVANRSIFNTEAIKNRGPALEFNVIPKDDRYLISEMACKSYGDLSVTDGDLYEALVLAWQKHDSSGGGRISVKGLLDLQKGQHSSRQDMFTFSADDMIGSMVSSEAELRETYARIFAKFDAARKSALENTALYLSLVNDLDIYVATSMRTRSDFRSMADHCAEIFEDERVKGLHLRYFDPTISAADGHQDKGLIECLMVKCAKVLVYCAGDKESFGKDAEAAMALSLGKPVIFLCNEKTRTDFYKEVHPLSRLINFETGVAVGAIVTSNARVVSQLLDRIFENTMEYDLIQHDDRPGYLQLSERITGSIVRIQTNNSMLSEAFWNYYRAQS